MEYNMIPIISKYDLFSSGDWVQRLKDNKNYIELSQGKFLSVNLSKDINFIPFITFDGLMFKETNSIIKTIISIDFIFPFLEGGINVLTDFAKGVAQTNSMLVENHEYNYHYLFLYLQDPKFPNLVQLRILSGAYNNFGFNITAGTNTYNGSASFTILNSTYTSMSKNDFSLIFDRNKYTLNPSVVQYSKIKLSEGEYKKEAENSPISLRPQVIDKLIQNKTIIINYQIDYLVQELSESLSYNWTTKIRNRFYSMLQKTFIQSISLQVANNLDVFSINDKPLYFRNVSMPYQINVGGVIVQLSPEEENFINEVFDVYNDLDTIGTFNLYSQTGKNLFGDKTFAAIKRHNFILKIPYLKSSNNQYKNYVVIHIQPQNISTVKAGDYGRYYRLNITGMVTEILKA